jgi:hypothetical protein
MEEANEAETARISNNSRRLDDAANFSEVYEVVKDTVKQALGKYRIGMYVIFG